MENLIDLLIATGSFFAAIYCLVLSKRIKNFKSASGSIGELISQMNETISQLQTSLQETQKMTRHTENRLKEITHSAEQASDKLEILIASTHDIEESQNTNPIFSRNRFVD